VPSKFTSPFYLYLIYQFLGIIFIVSVFLPWISGSFSTVSYNGVTLPSVLGSFSYSLFYSEGTPVPGGFVAAGVIILLGGVALIGASVLTVMELLGKKNPLLKWKGSAVLGGGLITILGVLVFIGSAYTSTVFGSTVGLYGKFSSVAVSGSWGATSGFFTALIFGMLTILLSLSTMEEVPIMIPGIGSLNSAFGKSRPKGNKDDDLDRLTKLKALLDSGAISKEEYDAEKAKILGTSNAPTDEAP
jgi:hypothetical protein